MTQKILLVDDEPLILDAITRCLYDVDADIYRFPSPREALDFVEHQRPDLIISDQRMPGMLGTEMLAKIRNQWPQVQCILLSAYNDFDAVAEAFNQQVIERYICKPWDDQELEFVVKKSLQENLIPENIEPDERVSRRKNNDSFHGMVSNSASMEQVFLRISKAATANVPVFITGETGTGKELVAKACHQEGFYRSEPFIAVNCANFSENLIESQLFGHKKGAFTGADKEHRGLMEEAGRGTLFLDEVTTLPLPLQAKLLRVIQEREFSPLGSHQLKPFEAQLITASSTTLQSAVVDGNFREDLFYRLNVLVIELPALRQRGTDVGLLANYLLCKLSAETGREDMSFSPSALGVLCEYSWPGNIRQLENFVHGIIALSNDSEISDELCREQLSYFEGSALPTNSAANIIASPVSNPSSNSSSMENSSVAPSPNNHSSVSSIAAIVPSEIQPLWLQEKQAIEQAIEHCQGNIPRAAALLEVSPSTIYRKIQAWESKGVNSEGAE
ncbi:MAG: sigma-54-dependent transcriptional regulator [Cellvibrionaceae bacterium]